MVGFLSRPRLTELEPQLSTQRDPSFENLEPDVRLAVRNSTLRKLPIPFMAACCLGICTIGVLLFVKNNGSDVEQTAEVQAAEKPKSGSLRPSNSSTRYRTGNVAKLNRQGGTSYRPDQTVGSQVAETTASPEVRFSSDAGSVPELTPAEPGEHEIAGDVLDETPGQLGELDTRLATTETNPEPEAVVPQATALPTPAQTKTATVAARLNPSAGTNKYSPQETDPSQALSEALDESSEPTDIVMPDLDPEDVVLPESESVVSAQQKMTELTPSEAASDEPVELATKEQKAPVEQVIAGQLTPEKTTSSTVTIQNPDENELPVWFVAKQRKIQLQPGQKYVCPASDDLGIRFARGGDLGVEKPAVTEGTWSFSVSREDGWKLSKVE